MPETTRRALRYDRGALGRATRTPQGFLRVRGNLTRTGVLTYQRADGTTFRELRHPDEVFRSDAVESLAGAPVTDGHPAEGMVTPLNVQRLGKGFVVDAREAGRFIEGDLIIQTADLLEKVEKGDARELSPGYTCRVDETPGVFEGERYDGVQRDIQYNHLAIGPRAWGRSGPEVAIHLDGKGAGAAVEIEPRERRDAPAEPERSTVDMITIRVDGIDVEVPKQSAQIVNTAIAKSEKARADEAKRADELEAKLDGVTKERDELKGKLDDATNPAKIQAAVQARAALEAGARKVLGAEAKLDGKTDRDVHVEVIRKTDSAFDPKDRSDDYLRGRFEHAVETAAESSATPTYASRQAVHDALAANRGAQPSTQRSPAYSVDEVRLRADDRLANDWKRGFRN